MKNIGRRLLLLLSGFKKFLRYSWPSLLIVFLIFLLSTMDQGQTVFIDILDKNPINLIFFFIILDGLAVILSHYPIFIEKSIRQRNESKNHNRLLYYWVIDYTGLPSWMKNPLDKLREKLGLGIVTFVPVGSGDLDSKEKIQGYGVTKFFRSALGLTLYLSFLYLLLLTHEAILWQKPGIASGNWRIILFFFWLDIYCFIDTTEPLARTS